MPDLLDITHDQVADEQVQALSPSPLTAQEPYAVRGPAGSLDRDVQVTVYRPEIARRGELVRFPVFVHRAVVADRVASLARLLLGSDVDAYSSNREDVWIDVRQGCDITIEGWLDGGECNPGRVTFQWRESLHHVLLLFRYDGVDEVVRGGVRVFADQIILGEVTFAIHMSSASARGPLVPIPTSPVRPQRVFASYSHKDKAVVRQLAAAAPARLRVHHRRRRVRSGERWSERIDEADPASDAVQLFWSTHSMRSPHVRHEWEVALALGRPEFVKPVYWQEPRPEEPPFLPPPALNALHFSKLELKGRRRRP